jgi:2-polyprenyl-3-methyl-5-hydroxy-6-metoxy-1,4-benzoquinol methylase/methyltransferase-like protein
VDQANSDKTNTQGHPSSKRADDLAEAAYDQVPYRSQAWPESRPEFLATLGFLYGFPRLEIGKARILELGCGDGGNLIPLAVAYPDSTLVGIDISSEQIKLAKQASKHLNLRNLSLEAQRFSDLSTDTTKFDIIIAHGILSWVAPEVQLQVLKLCQQLLADQGLVFLSYNALPGWHGEQAIRDNLLMLTQKTDPSLAKVKQGLHYLEFMRDHAMESDSVYQTVLKTVSQRVEQSPGIHFFAHEYLSSENHAYYFTDFVEKIKPYGLKVLCHAEHSPPDLENLDADLLSELSTMARDSTELQQYADFFTNKRFHQHILCHDSVKTSFHVNPVKITELWITSSLQPASNQAHGTFVTPHGQKLEITHDFYISFFNKLAERWPSPTRFHDIFTQCVAENPTTSPEHLRQELEELCELLLQCFYGNIVSLSLNAPPYQAKAGERPCVSALVRQDVANDQPTTNLLHQSLYVDDPLLKEVFQKLDGTHDRQSLLTMFENQITEKQWEKVLKMAAESALLVPESPPPIQS